MTLAHHLIFFIRRFSRPLHLAAPSITSDRVFHRVFPPRIPRKLTRPRLPLQGGGPVSAATTYQELGIPHSLFTRLRWLLELGVFGFGGDEYGDVGVGIFPQRKEIFVAG